QRITIFTKNRKIMFAKGYIVFLFYVSGNISFWGKWLKSHIIGTFAPIFPKTKHVFGNYF
ncbi:hypothetical protein DXC15_10275, partial [Ruminococcus sp. OM08-13AT]